LHRLGQPQEARELVQEELELSRQWGAARNIGISLRALGLVEGGRTGDRLLREAVDVLTHSPARLEHARALVDLGAALRRANSRSEARQLLRQGIELAHQCGASALVTLANEELAATGAHARTILLSGLDALTASERRVAQMAAEDLSNKEIAQTLFVTVKTVEQHLGRVYRKLDIGSRRELGAALWRGSSGAESCGGCSRRRGRQRLRSCAPSCWPARPGSALLSSRRRGRLRQGRGPSRRSRCCTAFTGWPRTSLRAPQRCSSS